MMKQRHEEGIYMATSPKTRVEAIPGLSNPAKRALAAAGYQRLGELEGASEKELLALHGFGPNGIRILQAALLEAGLKPIN
jgi:hypothetical protein